MKKTVLFQTIHFSLQKQLQFKQFRFAKVRSLYIKTVLFQAIQFSISSEFSSIWPVDRMLSGTTTPGQRITGSDGNEGLDPIPRRPCITETSPWDCLASYLGHSLRVPPLIREEVGAIYSLSQPCNLESEYLARLKNPMGKR